MSVDEIAKKLVFQVQGRTEGLLTLADEWDELTQDIAAALRAERQRAERAMLLAWGGVAGPNWAWSGGDIEEVAERIRHRGDELQEQVKQLTAERAKFAAGERTHVLDALCDMGWPQLASDLQARLEQKDAATKQAAEDAAGGKK